MPITSPQDFKDAAARRRKTVDVELDGLATVRLRALSGWDAMRFQADVKKAVTEGRGEYELMYPLIARSWINEDGTPLYPETEGEAIARELDSESTAALVKAVLILNGLSVEAIEEAEKN